MENKTPSIVDTSRLPPDQRTRQIVIRALEIALVTTADKRECAEFNAVLLALKAVQNALPGF